MSDDDLIKLAISAAPEAVTKDATVVMVASEGKTRTLRQGSGQWTCMPGHADPANPDPMCGDKNAMEWAAAWIHEPDFVRLGFLMRHHWRYHDPSALERRRNSRKLPSLIRLRR